ncbi:putative protein kinase [Leptomonas pyrrhocoris]|uniref:non-specific serine/threonine protein kinase n=1 Tax=Leptomonas pyrrhocoris TaxID=157538 RepID=A0A0M9G5V6_LEPPY|nr:putative protein kinase [Leptomonas pyrrhocoris]KPA83110.1 putative protein kinase [Leptomonas pyrrhocoris]|eukprot:XP_015661549.1 putative protein kinase [Leptomonas pyrrhocoris]
MSASPLSSACVQFLPEQLSLSAGTPVGSGAISHVVQCRLRSAGHPSLPVVVKIVSKLQVLQQGKVQSVMNEKAALLRLGPHPYIARLYGTSQSEDELYYVLEWLPHGDLLQHIRRTHLQRVREYNNQSNAADSNSSSSASARVTSIPTSSNALRCLDFHDIRLITAQLITALACASAKGVVLRDLKPENVAFDEKYRACLLDFDTVDLGGSAVVPETNNGVACPPPCEGAAYVVDGEPDREGKHRRTCTSPQALPAAAPPRRRLTVSEIQSMRKRSASFCGTAQYVSPEMVGECKWSFSSDLWALGALVYEMAYGTHLFAGMSQFEVLKKVIQGDYLARANLFPAIDFNGSVSNDGSGGACQDNFAALVDFIRQLLNIDPSKRLGVNRETHRFDEAALRGHAVFGGFAWEQVDEQLHTFRARAFPASCTSVTSSALSAASHGRSACDKANKRRNSDSETDLQDERSIAAAAAVAKVALAALEEASVDPSPSLAALYHVKPFNDPSYAEYVYKATADANFFEKCFVDKTKEAAIHVEGMKDEPATEAAIATNDASSSSASAAGKMYLASSQSTNGSTAAEKTDTATRSSGGCNADTNPTADVEEESDVVDDVGMHYAGQHAHPDFQA